MKIKLHYTINGYDDSLTVCGDTIEEIRGIVADEMRRRNLDQVKNNCWSEILEAE